MDLVEKARIYATAAFAAVNKRRKYSDVPYIQHPTDVVAILQAHSFEGVALATGWLHDLVEDTAITLDDILEEFGSDVAELVRMVTDVSSPTDGNRAARKALDREHAAKGCAISQSIKLADIISNTETIAEDDPDFARTYLKEKRAVVNVLTKGDQQLRDKALMQIEVAMQTLQLDALESR